MIIAAGYITMGYIAAYAISHLASNSTTITPQDLWLGVQQVGQYAQVYGYLLLIFVLLFLLNWRILSRFTDDLDPLLVFICALVTAPLLAALILLVFKTIGLPFDIILFIPLLWVNRLRELVRSLRTIMRREMISLLVAALLLLVIHARWSHGSVLPAYVDSVQHTRLIQSIAEQCTLPDTLPDCQDCPLVYHFGIHGLAASVTMFSQQRIAPEVALMSLGPILLMLLALGIYGLVRHVTQEHTAALAAMVVSSLGFSMPTQALNWGKYPLLLAMASWVGVFLLLVLTAQRSPRLYLGRLWIGALLVGTVIAHTRMLFLWSVTVPVLMSYQAVRLRSVAVVLKQWLLNSLIPIIFIALWFIPVWLRWRTLVEGSVYTDLPPDLAQSAMPTFESVLWQYRFGYAELFWLGVILVGFVITNNHRHAKIWILCSSLGLGLLMLPAFESLPGRHLLDAPLVYAILTIPIGIGLGTSIHGLSKRLRVHNAFGLIVIGLVLGGVSARNLTYSACCQLATPDDLAAYAWIKNTLPPSAKFGIAVEAWGLNQVVGVDGGYWITALTGRPTTLPSLFYGFSPAAVQAQINTTALTTHDQIWSRQDIYTTGINYNYDYIYVGSQKKSFYLPYLESLPYLSPVFKHGTVAIFKVSKPD